MSKNKSRELPVLSIAFVTGEEIEPKGLPKLKVYEHGEDYLFAEGYQEIISALSKSIKHLRESEHTLVFLAVEIIPEPKTARRRRRRRKTTTAQERGQGDKATGRGGER